MWPRMRSQPLAVQVEDGLHELLSLGLRRGVGERSAACSRASRRWSRAWNSRPSSVSVISTSWQPPARDTGLERQRLHAEHRHVPDVEQLAVAQVHVDAAGQARVEAADRPHDVDALELVRPVLLEDRRVLHRVLVGAGRAVDVARAGVPGRRRIGMVVGDLAVADDDVMRQHAAHRLVEAAADGLVGHLELGPGLRVGRRSSSFMRLLDEVERRTPPRRPGSRSGPGRARWRCSTWGSSTRTRPRAASPSWAGRS